MAAIWSGVVPQPVGGTPHDHVLGEFREDGVIDLAVTTREGGIGILNGTRDGGPFETFHLIELGTLPGVVAMGDFDGNVDKALERLEDNIDEDKADASRYARSRRLSWWVSGSSRWAGVRRHPLRTATPSQSSPWFRAGQYCCAQVCSRCFS